MSGIKALLVDDHEIVRARIRTLLVTESDIVVVGECRTGSEGIREVGKRAPDVVLMEARLPGASGVEACRDIRSQYPGVRVLLLTSVTGDEAAISVLMAGASGYILKTVEMGDLVDGVRRVVAGESLLDHDETRRLIAQLHQGRSDDVLLARLSEQERTIVGHMAVGLTNPEIADQMFLPESTVRVYIANLLAKVGVGGPVGRTVEDLLLNAV